MRCQNDWIIWRLRSRLIRRANRVRRSNKENGKYCILRGFGAELGEWQLIEGRRQIDWIEQFLLIPNNNFAFTCGCTIYKTSLSPQSQPLQLDITSHSSDLPTFSINLLKIFDLLVNSSSFAGANPPFLIIPSNLANSLVAYVSLLLSLSKTLT
jgi:hypothetical protein